LGTNSESPRASAGFFVSGVRARMAVRGAVTRGRSIALRAATRACENSEA